MATALAYSSIHRPTSLFLVHLSVQYHRGTETSQSLAPRLLLVSNSTTKSDSSPPRPCSGSVSPLPIVGSSLLPFAKGKRTRPAVAKLPNELYRLIFSFLPKERTLYPLLLVNSTFHAEAERLIYARVLLKLDITDTVKERVNRRVRLYITKFAPT
jgi:hypothetical protein